MDIDQRAIAEMQRELAGAGLAARAIIFASWCFG
jgi:hypothetical protein